MKTSYRVQNNQVPKHLLVKNKHHKLIGNYTHPLPSNLQECTNESKNRGVDVINLVASIHKSNMKIESINKLSD
jgi:hypothetical protein